MIKNNNIPCFDFELKHIDAVTVTNYILKRNKYVPHDPSSVYTVVCALFKHTVSCAIDRTFSADIRSVHDYS